MNATVNSNHVIASIRPNFVNVTISRLLFPVITIYVQNQQVKENKMKKATSGEYCNADNIKGASMFESGSV